MIFDLILQGGTIIDGTGHQPAFSADIGIIGEQIVAITDLSEHIRSNRYSQVIDATNQVICPGFIDVHVHSEISLLGGRDQYAGILQGVTTQLLAPDGFGWSGLKPKAARQFWHYTQFAYGELPAELQNLNWPHPEDYLDVFRGRIPANVCPQVPHCAVRLAVMGWENRPATVEELSRMERLTEIWMEVGAVGICLGLDYQPSANADINELVTLCRTVQSHGGIYAAHIRYELLGRTKAWQETIDISRQANIPVHISHERVDSTTRNILEQVDQESIDLTFESYLYPAGMTHLAMRLPMDLQIGTPAEMINRLRQDKAKDRAIRFLETNLETDRSIIGYTKSGKYVGLPLSLAAKDAGQSVAEFAYNLVVEEEGIETLIMFWPIPPNEAESVLNETAVHPRMMVASDGIYEIPHPHPRGYGCFAQFIRKFVRESKLLTLEQAIWKMSGFPAKRFGLKGRGEIKEGSSADLVVFDPTSIADRSTWADPIQPAIGLNYVLVNGEIVLAKGTITSHLPGRILRRS